MTDQRSIRHTQILIRRLHRLATWLEGHSVPGDRTVMRHATTCRQAAEQLDYVSRRLLLRALDLDETGVQGQPRVR